MKLSYNIADFAKAVSQQSWIRVLRHFQTHQDRTYLLLILSIGLVLRLLCFSGDGLGDDPNYFAAYKTLYDGHFINSQYFWRFSDWIPHLLAWKIFGISEFTFILPILFYSEVIVALVFLICRDFFDSETARIAGLLAALQPFEVLNSTLFSSDVILSAYMLASVYFFRAGQARRSGGRFVLSAFFVLMSFWSKPFGLYISPVLLILFLSDRQKTTHFFKSYMAFVLGIIAFFSVAGLIAWGYCEDPFIYITIFEKEPFHKAVIDMNQLGQYVKPMFFASPEGHRLHGFHFHTVLLCLLIFFVSLFRRTIKESELIVGMWFLLIFGLIEFCPHAIENGRFLTAQRIFRYVVPMIAPSVIFAAPYWRRLLLYRNPVSKALFVLYLMLSVYSCFDASRISRMAFGEVSEATKFLRSLGNVRIQADYFFVSKLQRFRTYRGDGYAPQLICWFDTETPEQWAEKFGNALDGYVVTGGPRMVYYGCDRCIPNLDRFVPPPSWTMVKEFSPELHPPWKKEPLRIWKVERTQDPVIGK